MNIYTSKPWLYQAGKNPIASAIEQAKISGDILRAEASYELKMDQDVE